MAFCWAAAVCCSVFPAAWGRDGAPAAGAAVPLAVWAWGVRCSGSVPFVPGRELFWAGASLPCRGVPAGAVVREPLVSFFEDSAVRALTWGVPMLGSLAAALGGSALAGAAVAFFRGIFFSEA